MIETPTVHPQILDYYNFCVIGNFVIEYEKPPADIEKKKKKTG
jgi:hypothetical protein